jgi:hypothetical protein
MKYTNSLFSFALKPTVLYVREDDSAVSAAAVAAAETAATKAVQDRIDAAVASSVAGLKAKNDELLGKLKDSNTKMAAFGNLDPERAKALIETMDNDEDLKLFTEGKKAVVIDKYTERMRTAHTNELEAERARTVQETNRADAYKGAVLDNQIRAVTSECHKGAVEDALLLARQIFTLDAKGNAVKLDSEGRPELGKDGKTPFSPKEWMEMQREVKPHWFPAAASGSGSGAAKGGTGAGKTIKRSEFNALSPAQQGNTARAGIVIVD